MTLTDMTERVRHSIYTHLATTGSLPPDEQLA